MTAAAIAVFWGVYASSPSPGAGAGMGSGVRALTAVPARDFHAWSAPRVLARCALAGGPQVAFPSEGAAKPTGEGAISWLSDPAPCASRSGRSGRWGVSVAALGSTDQAKFAGVQSLQDRPGPARCRSRRRS